MVMKSAKDDNIVHAVVASLRVWDFMMQINPTFRATNRICFNFKLTPAVIPENDLVFYALGNRSSFLEGAIVSAQWDFRPGTTDFLCLDPFGFFNRIVSLKIEIYHGG